MSRMHLRRASLDDAEMVFTWRNDPWIVSLSSSRHEVSWEEHRRWFASVIGSGDHLLSIIQADGQDAGIVRLDRHDQEEASITIYLLQSFTGRRLGGPAVEAASRAGFQRWPDLQRIVAQIRRDNHPSLRVFQRCGFRDGHSQNKSTELLKLILERVTMESQA